MLWLNVGLVVLVIGCVYCVWWERLFDWGRPSDLGEHPPLPYVLKFNAPIAQLVRWLARSKGANYAVTLPHPWRKACVVFVARHYVTARHLAHEVGGHGAQLCAMGPVDYTATYLWHFILRRGSATRHMMEMQAERVEASSASEYPTIGTP